MLQRLGIDEPRIVDFEAAELVLSRALRGGNSNSRAEVGLRIAGVMLRGERDEIGKIEERRLEFAYARVLARENSNRAEKFGLSGVDYARTLLVDVSLQSEAETALQMDVIDRRDHYSWLNSDLQETEWAKADVSPSEFQHFNEDALTSIASGRFEELPPYLREGVEIMLMKGMSGRDESYERDLHLWNAEIFSPQTILPETLYEGSLSIEDATRFNDYDEDLRFGQRSGDNVLTPREIEGLAERIAVARNADLYRDHSGALFDDRPGRNPFVVPEGAEDRGKSAVQAAGNGFKRNRIEKAARVALEFQFERGISLDRSAFQRMERAAARVISTPNAQNMSDLDMAKALIVDSSIQKIASEATDPIRQMQSGRKTASEQILYDLLGRDTVPVFTRLEAERDETASVAAGRFERLTDARGMGSIVRQAIYRSGRDVDGEVGLKLEKLDRAIRIGSAQEQGWIDMKADKAAGAAKLKGLSQGPSFDAPAFVRPGIER